MQPVKPLDRANVIEAVENLQSQEPITRGTYYCVTLMVDESGRMWHSVQSAFTGFTETTPHFEIREPCVIDPQKMRLLLQKIDQQPFIINNERDCLLFMLLGGHGIIRRELAEAYFPAVVARKQVAPHSGKPGFVSVASIPPCKFVKRPRPRIKRKVRERDAYKCKICGRREPCGGGLTLHHITMRKWGGLTEENNLILICRACHDGLDDINNYAMYEWIGIDQYAVDSTGREYHDAVVRYRRASFGRILKEHGGDADKST